MIELAVPKLSTTDCMIYLHGKDKPSFRCECGCNVFRKYENEDRYVCNACEAAYNGS